MEEPTPKIGRKKLTTGMISTLKNVAIRKDAIPPVVEAFKKFVIEETSKEIFYKTN